MTEEPYGYALGMADAFTKIVDMSNGLPFLGKTYDNAHPYQVPGTVPRHKPTKKNNRKGNKRK